MLIMQHLQLALAAEAHILLVLPPVWMFVDSPEGSLLSCYRRRSYSATCGRIITSTSQGEEEGLLGCVCDALSWSPMLLCGQCVDCALTHDTNITVPPSVANR